MAAAKCWLVLGSVTGVAASPLPRASRRLIDFGGSAPARWLTLAEVDQLASEPGRVGGFFDVTDLGSNWSATKSSARGPRDHAAIPDEPKHQELVKGYLNLLNESAVEATIDHLSSYHTRYYTTDTGAASVRWLEAQYKEAAAGRTDVAIQIFEHSWVQPSLIVTIPGTGNRRAEVVVLGGHIDSTTGSANSRAPGADDDGSGSAAVLEVFRILMQNRFQPDRTVEFHAYAAEEVGLRGSQAIAQFYEATGRAENVVSMVQFDMLGYPADMNIPIGLTEDYVDPTLTAFVGKLTTTYSILKVEPSICGYACSDHASWERVNVPSSFPFECKFGNHNPQIHRTTDTLAHMSMPRVNEFIKMGVGYVVELADPVSPAGQP